MAIPSLYQEEENKKKSFVISIATHVLLLLFLLIPFLAANKIFPPEESGILVIFGDVNAGSDSEPENVEENTSSKAIAEVSSNQPKESFPAKTEPIKIESKTKTEVSEVIAVDRNKTKAEEEKAKAAEKSKKEAEAKAQAEKEAKEKAELEKKKKQFSDLFGTGSGTSNTGGNQGDPKGTPDGKVLEGISKGSGKVGGGLSGRGVEFEPVFSDNTQKTGRVVLSICVGTDGKVTSAVFTQRGSTTSDTHLIDIARKNALKYKFSKSDIESQCGSLTVDFKVQ